MITNGQCFRMLYSTYERDIVVGHGVVLDGWPFPSMKSPSSLGSSIQPLNMLLVALKGSEHHPPTCKWRRLTDDEVFEKTREFLKDNSLPHKRKVLEKAATNLKRKRARLTNEFINDDDNNESDGNGEQVDEESTAASRTVSGSTE